VFKKTMNVLTFAIIIAVVLIAVSAFAFGAGHGAGYDKGYDEGFVDGVESCPEASGPFAELGKWLSDFPLFRK